jgi:hypothetical protein
MQAPRPPKEFWINHIAAWKASGLTQVEYCAQNKDSITLNQLTYQNSKNKPKVDSPKSGFATVSISTRKNEGLTLTSPTGCILTGIDASNIMLAKQLAEALS